MKWYFLTGILSLLSVFILSGCLKTANATSAKMMAARQVGNLVVYPDSWKKGSVNIVDADLKAKLTPLQYSVTRQADTEQPFDNPYFNNEDKGIYVDIISGEPLFSSTDKFDSGTGWPSFTKPLSTNSVELKQDNSFGMVRTEVIARMTGSHLGHLFDDGPAPTGLRYCMNSAALVFVPVADMQAQGYGDYLKLFAK